MGLATSTLSVDQAPAAGLKAGTGRFGRVVTMRTPVILSLLFSWQNARGGTSTMLIAASPPNLRNDLRSIVPSIRPYSSPVRQSKGEDVASRSNGNMLAPVHQVCHGRSSPLLAGIKVP